MKHRANNESLYPSGYSYAPDRMANSPRGSRGPWPLLAVAAIGVGGFFGIKRYAESLDCSLADTGIAQELLCEWQQMDRPPMLTTSSQESGGQPAAEAVMQAAPEVQSPAVNTLTNVNTELYGNRAQWWTPPGTDNRIMIIDNKYPVVYTNFDDQWIYPAGEKGGRCGEGAYASGLAWLLGEFVSPVTIWKQIEQNGGHSPTGSGLQSHRGLVADLYGLESHKFGSLQEAEQYARNVDPNIYVIIGQNRPSDSSFSPYGSHIVGLHWVEESNGWQAADPNDYFNSNADQVGDPSLQDNLRIWSTSEINGLYDIQGWTNPGGVPDRHPWQTN